MALCGASGHPGEQPDINTKCHCYSAVVTTTEPVQLLSITPVSDQAQASLEELAPRTL